MSPSIMLDATFSVLALVLVILPGLALLLWLTPRLEVDWFGQLMLSAGLSLALFPLLFLWLSMAHVGIRSGVVWAFVGISAVAVAAGFWRRRRPAYAGRPTPRHFGVLALALLAATVAVRCWAIRGMTMPSWADSYHHTMIAQLLVDNGGLFQSWEPYVPLATFTYHFGFHTFVALMAWLTGDGMPHAILASGQVVNALAALTLYPLAVRLTGSRWAGLLACFTAAFLTPHPAYFVNWGRYTQLAGQAILPVALWFTWEVVDHRRDWSRLLLLGLTVAGLGLTHYRVIIMYGAVVGAWWLVYVLADPRWRSTWLSSLAKLSSAALLAALLAGPWLVHLAASRLLQQQVTLAAGDVTHVQFVQEAYNRLHDIRLFLPVPLLGMAAVGLLASLIERRRMTAFLALWVGFLFFLANPLWLHLPGTGLINNFAIFISFYMPAAILIACGMECIIHHTRRYWSWTPRLALVGVLGMMVYALPYQIHIVKPEFVLVTAADERAMAWIRGNTPPDAKFLINGFMAYGGVSPVGADAGWWIPLLTGRQNTIPPMVFSAERASVDNLGVQARAMVSGLQQAGIDTEAGLALLRHYDVSHIYIGEKEGHVWNTGAALLSAATLQASAHFHLLYQDGNVWIFQVLPE